MALCYGEGSLLKERCRGKIWKHGGRLVFKQVEMPFGVGVWKHIIRG